MVGPRHPRPGAPPTVGYVWGPVRPVVNAVAAAWLRELAPDPEWFDVRPESESGAPDPAEAAGFPSARRHRIREPSAFAPGPGPTRESIGGLVRPDDPAGSYALLTGFLTIPAALREVTNLPRAPGGAPALGLANCDRLRPYYPGFAANNRDRIEALRAAGASVVFTVTGEPAPDRMRGPFDAVVRVEAPSLAGWRDGTALAERGPGPGRLRSGDSTSLATIPEVARILQTLSGPD